MDAVAKGIIKKHNFCNGKGKAVAVQPEESKEINFNLDPSRVHILSVDSYLIGSNATTVTFNFAQASPDGVQHTIVSRVAMTLPQAKEFLKGLSDHIEKFER